MKKSLLLSLSCAALLHGTVSFTAAAASDQDTVLVNVNDAGITRSAYDDYVKSRSRGDVAPNPSDVIEEMLSLELLYQQAVAEKLDQQPELQKKLADARYNILAEAMQNAHLKTLSLGDKELKAEYDRILSEVERPMEYKARHILVKTEEEATAILEELKAGKDFAEIAKAKSQDPGSGKNGGDLGWFDARRMVKPFGDALLVLKKGERSEPVKTDFGWHIIEMEDSRKVEPPPFESVKEQLHQRLEGLAMRTYIKGLKDKAIIKTTAAFDAMKPPIDQPAEAPAGEK